MTSFKDRENAFESKYANDQEKLFRLEARTSKLFGLWVAGQMGLSGDDAATYAKTMVSENLSEVGYDDIKRKAMADFALKNLPITEHMIDTMIDQCMADADKQLQSE